MQRFFPGNFTLLIGEHTFYTKLLLKNGITSTQSTNLLDINYTKLWERKSAIFRQSKRVTRKRANFVFSTHELNRKFLWSRLVIIILARLIYTVIAILISISGHNEPLAKHTDRN